VAARLARLSPGARRSVEAAAVTGYRAPASLLSALGCDDASVDECTAAGLLTPDGRSLRFRHELARMAVEADMPVRRRRELHTRILAELEAGAEADAAVLAHHAAGADDRQAIARHAPAAGRRSSALGAHREAAAHYEHALACSDWLTQAEQATLREALAEEYSLLDRWHETEQALRAALETRQALGDTLSAGRLLRLLSTALWRLCRGDESERAAYEAVAVLETRLPSPELAWAYGSLGIAATVAGRSAEADKYLAKALALGEQLEQPDVVCYALNAIGLTLTEAGKDGTPELELALQTALDAGIERSAGQVYTSLQESAVMLHRFEDADRYYTAGTAYCEERELGVYATCLRGWRSWGLLLRGRWDEAIAISTGMLSSPGLSPVNKLNPLRVQGAILARRGEPRGWELLDEAVALADSLADPAWIMPIRALRAELRWRRALPSSRCWKCWPAGALCTGTSTRGPSGQLRSGWPG
jgi:tetratricopeptide (TPR) repeat protein